MASPPSDDNLGPMVLAVCWSMTGVATLFLGARLYVKFHLRHGTGLWWDDAILAASLVMLISFSSIVTYAVDLGLGRHIVDIRGSSHAVQLAMTVAMVFSLLGAAWSKTSFALTLLRLTRSGTRLRKLVWFIIVSLNSVMVFNAVLQFIWCQPTWTIWHGGEAAGGVCWSKWVLIGYSVAAVGYLGAVDLILAVIPWVIIVKLKMDTREKIGVAVCMSLGVL